MQESDMERGENTPKTAATTATTTPIKLLKNVRKVDSETEKIVGRVKLPKFPAKVVTFDQLMEWLAILTNEMRPHVDVYVYRDRPIIMKDPKYIGKYTAEELEPNRFNLQWFTKTYGGGEYHLDINNRQEELPSGQYRSMRARLSVSMVDYDPILDYETLDKFHEKNQAYVNLLKNKGILDKEGNVVANQKEGLGEAGTLVRDILDRADKMNDKQTALLLPLLKQQIGPSANEASTIKELMPLLLEKFKQDNPMGNVQQIMTMLTTMMATMGVGGGNNQPQKSSGELTARDVLEIINKSNETVMALMQKMDSMQIQSTNQQLEMMKIMMQQKETKNDPFEAMMKMFQIKELMDTHLGGGPSEKKEWYDRLFDMGEKVVPGVLGLLGNRNMGLPPQATQLPSQPQRVTPKVTSINDLIKSGRNIGGQKEIVGDNTEVPENVTIGSTSNHSGSGDSGMGSGEMGLGGDSTIDERQMIEQQIRGVIQQFGGRIQQAILQGQPGDELGEAAFLLTGTRVVHALILRFGPENVLAVAKTVPGFYEPLKVMGDEVIIQWLEDFARFDEKEEEDI